MFDEPNPKCYDERVEGITLKKALDEYKTIYMPYRNFADRTRVEYQNDLEDFIEFAEKSGVIQANKVGLPIVERFVASLEHKGYSSLTRKRKVVTIRSFLMFLYQDGYIQTNIGSRIILPFTEATTPNILTQAQCDRLRAACASSLRDRAIIELLLQTGIKLSELTRLTVNDIELPSRTLPETKDTGYLYIKGSKRQESRILPLNQKACLAIDLYLKQRLPQENSELFINRSGESLGPRGVEKIIGKYMQQAGINNTNVQSLRHTFGIYHALKGATIKTIQELMGYKDARSAMIYVSLTKEIRKEMQKNTL
jgi:site-specific recombinase XerD